MPLVAVSILNHGDPAPTVACVESLLRQAFEAGRACEVRIFVLDNGSGETERRRLQDGLPRTDSVELELLDDNLGFSAGHNRNMRKIAAHEPDFVWLLNNDCVVHPDCIAQLLECASRSPQTVLWGATLIEPGGETIQCAGGCRYNAWLSTYRPLGRGMPLSRLAELPSADFDYVAGASMFIPVGALESGFRPPKSLDDARDSDDPGFLNETFFLYFEELDLARRLRPGHDMRWCRNALVVHLGGQSTGASDNRRSERAEYQSTLSALKFTLIHHPGRLWFTMPARFFAKCVQLVFSGHPGLIGPVTRAYRDFIAGR